MGLVLICARIVWKDGTKHPGDHLMLRITGHPPRYPLPPSPPWSPLYATLPLRLFGPASAIPTPLCCSRPPTRPSCCCSQPAPLLLLVVPGDQHITLHLHLHLSDLQARVVLLPHQSALSMSLRQPLRPPTADQIAISFVWLVLHDFMLHVSCYTFSRSLFLVVVIIHT